jgi:hypothetical protein
MLLPLVPQLVVLVVAFAEPPPNAVDPAQMLFPPSKPSTNSAHATGFSPPGQGP